VRCSSVRTHGWWKFEGDGLVLNHPDNQPARIARPCQHVSVSSATPKTARRWPWYNPSRKSREVGIPVIEDIGDPGGATLRVSYVLRTTEELSENGATRATSVRYGPTGSRRELEEEYNIEGPCVDVVDTQ